MADAPPALILGGVAAAGVSDWLDGYLARRWNQQSVLGRVGGYHFSRYVMLRSKHTFN
jgi:hypothetical protein